MRSAKTAALVVAVMIGLPLLAAAVPTSAGEPTGFAAIPDDAFYEVPQPPAPLPTVSATVAAPTIVPTMAPPDVIVDIGPETPAPTRPSVTQPSPRLVVLPKGTTAPVVSGASGSHRLVGKASWYCRAGRSACMAAHPDTSGFDAYAAAGPKLRAAICGIQSCTSWRGRMVTVCAAKCARVKLADWCACYWKQPHEKVIDLYKDVWDRTISGGDNNVTVSW